ncbi:hypothetical protein [Actinomadura sp. 6N118]|uniref:hypothetical protein n=1 Tax=Actinomadura sp. 6N118 TaxID=3375151 RepID=UPI00379AE56A
MGAPRLTGDACGSRRRDARPGWRGHDDRAEIVADERFTEHLITLKEKEEG